MIKLTLREALDVSEALATLPPIPDGRASFALSRIRNKLKPELLTYVEAERALIEKYSGVIQPDGKAVAWPAPKAGELPPDVAFLRDQRELQGHEIEIDCVPVKIDAVIGRDAAKQPAIKPEAFAILEKIIVE